MLKVAIVEDDHKAAEALGSFFERYTAENGTEFQITEFPNAVVFLSGYRSGFDIVCMDIEMPHMNGMEAAKKLREIDDQVVLIFVTNLAQYAIAGYEVEALSYILKPLKYSGFEFTIKKAVAKCATQDGNEIEIMGKNTLIRLAVSSIRYVEIHDHSIVYHTDRGDYEGYGTMKKVEHLLPARQFFRCNNCYLVNLKHVKKIEGNNVWVGGEILQISRPRRKSFLDALHNYGC